METKAHLCFLKKTGGRCGCVYWTKGAVDRKSLGTADVDHILFLSYLFHFTFPNHLAIPSYLKGKVVLVHSMKAYKGSRGIALLIDNFDIRWRWVVNFTFLVALPPRKNPGTHWIGGCVGPRVGLDVVEKKKCLTPTGIEPRTFQPVA